MPVTLAAVLRGLAIGLAIGIAIGALTTVALTIVGWPSPGADATARARHLGESVSAGMHWALMTSLVMIPVCAIVLVRRARLATPRT